MIITKSYHPIVQSIRIISIKNASIFTNNTKWSINFMFNEFDGIHIKKTFNKINYRIINY